MRFEENIKIIEKKIGYTFKDKSLLRQAFTRTSFCNEHRGPSGEKYQSNEVLEFFGDSLLSAAIVTLLMRDFAKRYDFGISTELKEGDFSNIKSKLSDKKNLSLATKRLGLQEFLLMGEGDAKMGIQNEPSVMEDLFESIIGAVYIDSNNNMGAVIESVSGMLDVNEYISAREAPIQSYKNALQEWCADKKRRLSAPVYKTISETGPDHKKLYERACYIGEKIYGIGHGKNQKLADSAAAEEALRILKLEAEREKARETCKDASDVMQKLKSYAVKNKKISPEFRDLGESVRSSIGAKEYEIECRFSGLSAIGRGVDKHEAKARAAEKILGMITKPENSVKKKPKKAPVLKKQPAVQSKNANSKTYTKSMKKKNRKPESV